MSNPDRLSFEVVTGWRNRRGVLIDRGVKVRVGDYFSVVPVGEFLDRIEGLAARPSDSARH